MRKGNQPEQSGGPPQCRTCGGNHDVTHLSVLPGPTAVWNGRSSDPTQSRSSPEVVKGGVNRPKGATLDNLLASATPALG